MASAFPGIGILVNGGTTFSNFKTAVINFSGSGDNILVSGIANQTIRCFRVYFVVGGSTNLTFKDGSTAISGPLPMSANGALVFDLICLEPWAWASVGNNLILNSSAAVQVSGALWYQQS